MGGRGASSATGQIVNGKKIKATKPTRANPENYKAFIDKYRNKNGILRHLPGTVDEYLSRGLNPFSALQLYIDELDAYGEATVLSDDDFDKYVSDNQLVVTYRGMPNSVRSKGKDKNDNFIYDKQYYVGEGVRGDGMYFGDKLTAKKYADHGRSGSIIKAAIKPDAKIAEYTSLMGEFQSTSEVSSGALYNDNAALSVYALSRGYDVIEVKHAGYNYESYYVILNRNAVVVNETQYSPRKKNW